MMRSENKATALAVRGAAEAVPGTVAIFGSCVSRDLFESDVLRPSLGLYAARCSVVSAVAPPVSIDADRVELPSAWQRRCVLADFEKSFFHSLAGVRPDWLVIDLIDERFDLLRGAGSFVTRSSAFTAAGLDGTDGFEFLRRASPEGCELFDRAAGEFADRVTAILPPDRVVVHRALWCTHYRSDGEVLAFPEPRLTKCRAQNVMLSRGYDALSTAFGEQANIIAVDPEVHLADGAHRWGLEPYHYERAYNDEGIGRLRSLLQATRSAHACAPAAQGAPARVDVRPT